VVLSDNANGYVIADAMIAKPVPAIDLNWTGGSFTGPTTVATITPFTLSRTYNVSIGAAPSDFVIAYFASRDQIFADAVLLGTETITAAADKTVGTHSGTTPSLQFNSPGTYYFFAQLNYTSTLVETSYANNVIEDTTQVTVSGSTLIANGQPGYSQTGSGWTTYTGSGFDNQLSYASAGSGNNTATWQAAGLTAGTYDVQMTWSAYFNRASNATYQVFDGTTLVGTVSVNQQMAPAGGQTVSGVPFQSLGRFIINSGTLKVVLTDNANGLVIADAMFAKVLSAIDLNWTGGSFTGPTTVSTLTPFMLSRTYNVTIGPAPADFVIAYYYSTDQMFAHAVLLGTETITAPADKTVGLHSGNSPSFQFSAPGTYYFFAQLDSTHAFPETSQTDKVIEAPSSVTVSGATLVANGQTGYSQTGTGWTTFTGAGYNNHLSYAPAGSGSNTATWQTGLTAGNYDVQMTWAPYINRATNATYLVYDGTTLVGTVSVNQQTAPTGGQTVNGTPFQSLGHFAINSGTLKVVLSDNANGFVIADTLLAAPL
jgi:plastocyanin